MTVKAVARAWTGHAIPLTGKVPATVRRAIPTGRRAKTVRLMINERNSL